MIDAFQTFSRRRLIARGAAPEDHPVWTQGGCKRFLGAPQHVRTAIRYVENNPIKIGAPAQHWPFVTVYDNWPFHKRRS
jgi:hypothetical protein